MCVGRFVSGLIGPPALTGTAWPAWRRTGAGGLRRQTPRNPCYSSCRRRRLGALCLRRMDRGQFTEVIVKQRSLQAILIRCSGACCLHVGGPLPRGTAAALCASRRPLLDMQLRSNKRLSTT